MAKRKSSRKRLARERAAAIAMLVIVLFIAGMLAYSEWPGATASTASVKAMDSTIAYVILEVTVPQNTTIISEEAPAKRK